MAELFHTSQNWFSKYDSNHSSFDDDFGIKFIQFIDGAAGTQLVQLVSSTAGWGTSPSSEPILEMIS